MKIENPAAEIGWSELATIVLASRGITTGLWRLGVKLRFAAMNIQFPEELDGATNLVALPTSLAAIEAVVLFPAQAPGPMIFDAAELHSQGSTPRKSATPKASKPVARLIKTPSASSKSKIKR